MAGPDYSSRGRPANQSAPDFSNRGRAVAPAPAQRQGGQRNLADLISGRQRTNYVMPKRIGPINLTDTDDAPRLATQGFSFGQAPRFIGALGSVMGVPDAIRQRSLNPLAEAYRQNRQAEIDAIDAARRRMGLAGSAIEVVASLPTGGGLARSAGNVAARVAPRVAPRVAAALAPRAGPAVARVARATGRTAAAATAGAVAGGVYGSGEGRAAENALYGAAGGALAAPIARAAGGVVNGVRRMAGRPNVAPEVKAARVLVDRVNPQRAQAQIDEAARLGQNPLALIDVSKNSGRRLIRGLAGNTTDDAQQMAVDYAAATREALPDRGAGIARRLTGQDVNFPARQEAAQTNIHAVDNANYPQIMSERLHVTPEMLQSLRPADAQTAISNARRVAELSGRQDDVAALDTITNMLRSGDVSKLGNIEVSASSLEQIYRGLRDATSGLYADPSTRSVGNAMSNVRNSFDETLQAQSPAIAQARAASREARQGSQALDVGFNAFAPSRLPDALAVDVAALPQSARPNLFAGAQAQLEHQIGQNPFAAVSALGYRPNMAARLNAMGAPADDMVSAARMETQRVRNADFISPNTGSQTQLRATDLPEGMAPIPTTPIGWATKLADFAFRRINAFTDAEMEAIVRMGIEPADLPKLQALAARSPDQIPSAIKGLIGSSAGVGAAGQVNAGTSQGYRQ